MNYFKMQEKDYLIVDYDEECDKYSLNYTEFISPIIKSIQDVYIDYNEKINENREYLSSFQNNIESNQKQIDIRK